MPSIIGIVGAPLFGSVLNTASVGPARVRSGGNMGAVVVRDEVALGTDYPCQARITAFGGSGTEVPTEGNAVQRVDVASITCAVYDLGSLADLIANSESPATNIGTSMLTVAGSISDTLIVDDLWSRWGRPIDTIGRNFLFTVPSVMFTEQHIYRITFALTLGDGLMVSWAHELEAKSLAAV
jgi:hypothetical protein